MSVSLPMADEDVDCGNCTESDGCGSRRSEACFGVGLLLRINVEEVRGPSSAISA